MTAERGASLAPAPQEVPLGDTTIIRRVKRFTPELVKRWSWFARLARRSWRVDETYLTVRGKWVYGGGAGSICRKESVSRQSIPRDSTSSPCVQVVNRTRRIKGIYRRNVIPNLEVTTLEWFH
jgi:hypothetical protein